MTSRTAKRDSIICIGIVLGLLVLAGYMDLSEKLHSWLNNHEGWELDELATSIALGTAGFGWFSYRRWRELHREATRRNRTEESLRESQERLAGILDLALAAVVSIDDAQRIRLFNKGAEAIFGYAAEEVLGRSLEVLMPERFRHAHPGRIANFAQTPEASRRINERGEIVGLRKDGTEFPAEASISKFEQAGKTIFTAMLKDITERKQFELDREQANEFLLEAQRTIEEQTEDLMKLAEETDRARRDAEAANQAKSDFLASMSHEIRTPMNGVIGMAGVLLDSDLSVEQRKQVLTIKKSGDALLSLLNDILDLSKIEAGQVDLEVLDFDLQGLLDSVAALWDSGLRGLGLTLSIDVAPDVDPVLKSDPTRIRQILFNLIGNAAKFTDEGGVTLDVSQRHLTDGELELRFDVTDTGIGISPEAQSRLFAKFSQADGSVTRKYGGTGLGLAICKELAALLGGEIGFDSTFGDGSTFWFTVRCTPGDAEAVDTGIWTEETESTEAPLSDRPLRILAAEDNQVNQTVLLAMLSKVGHKIDMVANGSEAVSAVMGVPYDLVLMDVQMPEMDGITATRKIRGLPGEVGRVPIIALTANAMKGDREKYIEAGMTDYVSKPINPRKLFAAIARCTGRAPTDIPHGPAVVKPAAHDVAGAGDGADGLRDLMDDLDTLIANA